MGGNGFSIIQDSAVVTFQALHDQASALAFALPKISSTVVTNDAAIEFRTVSKVAVGSLVAWFMLKAFKEAMANRRLARKLRAQGIPEQKLQSRWWMLGLQRYLVGHAVEPSPHLFSECRASQQLPIIHGEDVDGWGCSDAPKVYLFRLFLGIPVVVLADPKALHAMLTLKSYSFVKPTNPVKLVSNITGTMGMLMIEGDVHKRHRRIANPLFNLKALKPLVPAILASLDEFFALVDQQPASTLIPFHELSSQLTLNAIGHAAMGYNFDAFNGQGSRVTAAYRNMLQHTSLTPWTLLTLQFPGTIGKIPTLQSHRFQNAFKVVESAVKDMLQNASKHPDGHMLIHELLRQNEQDVLSEYELVCEVRSFLGAGHETTAAAISSLVLLLALHPTIQQELHDEVESTAVALEDSDALAKLPLLNKVINEMFRLYPPTFTTYREAATDVTLPMAALGAIEIPAGTRFEIPIRAIHMDPSIWGDDAAMWNPHRWDTIDLVHGTSDVSANRIVKGRRQIGPYDFMPFLAGPRACVGRQFALMELRLFLAGIVQRYTLKTDIKSMDDANLTCAITMRSTNAWVRFEQRSARA
ncbi:hypothetical protein AMAG_13896 [Allomyces macrogynus ATCC 38327]|uniref:Cytochrome P450 n=1 Tax=Allomyces macrogynus (strain ATCC 38327) TaxID=578462 RepID=A0A0L0T2R1_ALLM3|nr:hypothetical protein AMAG_13896 [Allomyces macrogynus ATCC 38327]|eukprot:KNE69021.1 hypothetical protein AMAG_13896 [Allomyces macrogynus ATCC 38327]